MRYFILVVMGAVLSVVSTFAEADDLKPGRATGGGPETDPVATLLVSDGSGVTDVPGWWSVLAPGAALPSLDGSALTNLPASSSPGPYDWADPYYEAAGDSLSSVLLADWPDASTVGGASSICRDQILSRSLRLRATTSSDCTTDYGAATRVGGTLRSVAAGDFRVAIRAAPTPNSWANTNGSHFAGVVYVDGTDASTASWYGVAVYVYAGAFTTWNFFNSAGAARWETYEAGYTQILARYWEVMDVVFQRSGTTLTVYLAPARGAFVPVATYTVSADAGMVGLRTAVETATTDELDMTLLAYRAGLSEVP